MYLYELEELKDEIDSLIFEDEPSIITEEYALEIMETAFQLMEEFMNHNPSIITEPDFNEILFEEITNLFYIQFEEDIKLNDIIEDDINEILEEAFHMYITLFYPERSISDHDENIDKEKLTEEEYKIISDKINYLRSIPQPTQRTDDWYKFRHNLITASNAYKAFESQSMMNQLIYEKCQPLKTVDVDEKPKMMNLNNSLHWGQKYEPVSVMIYEDMYQTKVEDFGCIPHSTYKFLGASPDGIIVDKSSERYGRMLEIKNVVNREITGIPKKEYWIQMQLQMEVCDLDECDFLETKFTEYPDVESFYNDINGEKNEEKNEEKDIIKGSILYFNTNESKPFYLYKPIQMTDYNDINNWEEEMIELYQEEKKMVWIKNIYWKLEKLSCVLVVRNKEWFQNNVEQIGKIWKIIEEERITGYQHRAPNKKIKVDSISKPFINHIDTECCLLSTFVKG
jgi:putative phage-type endonuclease